MFEKQYKPGEKMVFKTEQELKDYQNHVALTEAIKDKVTEGRKDDSQKPILSLLPSSLLIEAGKVLTFGAKKYAAHNWRQGINQSRLISAALRHITAYNEGENIDPESGISHLAHAICSLSFCLEQQIKSETYASYDDRYKGELE